MILSLKERDEVNIMDVHEYSADIRSHLTTIGGVRVNLSFALSELVN